MKFNVRDIMQLGGRPKLQYSASTDTLPPAVDQLPELTEAIIEEAYNQGYISDSELAEIKKNMKDGVYSPTKDTSKMAQKAIESVMKKHISVMPDSEYGRWNFRDYDNPNFDPRTLSSADRESYKRYLKEKRRRYGNQLPPRDEAWEKLLNTPMPVSPEELSPSTSYNPYSLPDMMGGVPSNEVTFSSEPWVNPGKDMLPKNALGQGVIDNMAQADRLAGFTQSLEDQRIADQTQRVTQGIGAFGQGIANMFTPTQGLPPIASNNPWLTQGINAFGQGAKGILEAEKKRVADQGAADLLENQ